MNKPGNDNQQPMSPIGKMLWDCFTATDPTKVITNLNELTFNQLKQTLSPEDKGQPL